MGRMVRHGVLAVASCAAAAGWIVGATVLAAPWDPSGRSYEASDLPSVIVTDDPRPLDGQSLLHSEPAGVGDRSFTVGDAASPEDTTVPLFDERLQESIPSGPGLLVYDSPAASTPTANKSRRRHKDACWIVRAESMAVWRSAPSSRPLFTTLNNYTPGTIIPPTPPTGTLGPVVLDANQLVSDPAAAGRLSVIRVDECSRGFDASYLWAGTFYAQRSLPELTNGYALAYPGIYGNSWGLIPPAPPISGAQAQLVGSLQSAEINYREPIGWGANRFLVGFRWLQWQERFSMTDQYSDPYTPTVTGTDYWRTSCLNNLFGGQIGLDSVLWNKGEGFRLESLVKAGAYYNSAAQSSSYYYIDNSPFQSPYATISVNHPATCSFVGEVGLTAVVPLRKNLDLRCGYFGLWLSDLAQPTKQLSGQTLIPSGAYEPSGTLTTTSLVGLQGVSLGLEGRW